MIVLLSPAKSLDYQKPLPPITPTTPRFEAESGVIATAAAELSAKRLASMMNISDALATLNAERFAGFAGLPTRPALFAFAGDVYAGFDARTLDLATIGWAQDHVRILSGLYGLLRPLDAIRPYRLEMGTKWAPGAGDLYRWWGSRIGDAIGVELAAQGSSLIVNLASREYFGAVATAPPDGARIVTVEFREQGPRGLFFNSFNGKRARGAMARWICEQRIEDAESLKAFTGDGYAFADDGSEADRFRFVRG